MNTAATSGNRAAVTSPEEECDLIMRGGITSGVVFPKAITRLASRYRFRNIGGTSAGSIAAIMAVAAEYQRSSAQSTKGFSVIDDMAGDLAHNLKSMFQPSAQTAPLFGIAMAVQQSGGKFWSFVGSALRTYWLRSLLAAAPVFLIAAFSAEGPLLPRLVIGLLLAIAAIAVVIGASLFRDVKIILPQHDFGLCGGLRTEANAPPAFTDWIADKLDEVSGRQHTGNMNYRPLTAGDLSQYGLTVASVATDLSSGRPYQLPLGTRIFSFRKSEFERLFPARLLQFLMEKGGRLMAQGGAGEYRDEKGNSDYYKLPVGDDFPVLLVARLSLSFPGLISAVPLYRFDYTVNDEATGEPGRLVRCLFSDGGITSNFPIHFFDALIPDRPTFGISLGNLDKRTPSAPRIFLPTSSREGSAAAAHEITGIANFAGTILSTARNWQDNLQSRLHGYRERIVEIRLDNEKEGGLNLAMSEDTILRLIQYGADAGDALLDDFDFDEHRWRRAVTALPTLGETLEQLATVWDARYESLVLQHSPTGLTKLTGPERQRLADFAKELNEIGALLQADPLTRASNQKATSRIVASIDTGEI